MADVPGEGFEVGSAYVSVSPEAGDFQAEVEAIVGETDIVVQVPVVPDAADFRAALEEQVSAGDTAVQVPVVPDTAGFRLLLEDGLAGSSEPVTVPVLPDTAGFKEKLAAEVEGTEAPVEVPVVPDTAGFAAKLDAEAGTAGEEAAAAFGERFGAVAEGDAAEAGEAAGLTFSERFAAVTSRMQAFADRSALVGAAEDDGDAAGEGFIGRLKSVISGGMGSIEFLLGAGFVAASAVMANSFQEAMERIHTQAGVAQAGIAPLSNAVLNLAGQVGESPSSLAQALYHVESAFQSTGITGSQAMALLQTAAEGARVGGSDLVDTTNALDAIVVSGVGGLNSYAEAMGGVNAIVGSGDMTMQDFAEAAGSGLFAVAKSYGQTLPEIGAGLATFGDNNIRGAKAATDLRMAMQALLDPVKTGAAALAHLGLTSTQLGSEMEHHGLVAAVGDFIEHLNAAKIPISEWGQYVTEIFGKRAGVGIGVLVDQFSRFQGKLGDITGATHKFGSAWAATEATTSQKLHDLEAGLEALMIRIGQGLLPYLDDIFTAVTKSLPSIEKWGAAFAKMASPLVKASFTALAASWKVLTGALSALNDALPPGWLAATAAGIGLVVAGMKAWAMWTASLEAEGLAATIVGWVAAIVTLTAAMEGATIAEKAMFLAELAAESINPLAWAIAGGAAIAVLTGFLVKNTTTMAGFIATQRQAYDATGYNIAGYQHLAQALSQPIDATTKLGQAVMSTASPLRLGKDGAVAFSDATVQVGQAAQQASETASKLGDAMTGLGHTFGITEQQAITLAEKAGVQASAWLGTGQAVADANAKVLQYVLTNEHALGPQQELTTLMQVFGGAAYTASQQVTALDTSFKLLVGDFVSKQEAILNASSAVQQFGQQAAQSGASSSAANQSFYQAVTAIGQLGDTLVNVHTPMATMYQDLVNQISALREKGPLNSAEQHALEGLWKWTTSLAESTHGMTAQTLSAAAAMEGKFTPDVIAAGVNSATAKTDVADLTNAVINTGTQSEATHAARQQLIKDLEDSGIQASIATGLVNGYIQKLTSIPKNESTTLTLNIQQIGSLSPGTGIPGYPGNAAGGRIPGYGGGDTYGPVMLERGETVVDKARSVMLAPLFSAVGIPGYAGGGLVSSYGAIRRYAGGGAVTWDSGLGGNSVADLLMALLQALSGPGWGGGGLGLGGRGLPGGNTIEMNFNGTMWPTPEQQQAMSLMLTSAVSNA